MSAHDYKDLIKRWRKLARQAKLKVIPLCEADGFPLYAIESPALDATGGIYLSAGIHGDEPASVQGLFDWAEHHVTVLRKLPLFILPCLNPWGLSLNRRSDASGNDMNRLWHTDSHPVISAVKKKLLGRFFFASLMLHEDYDAEGVYLYEHLTPGCHWGEYLLRASGKSILPDPRSVIEGRRVLSKGLFRFKTSTKRFEQMGFPESVFLFQNYSERCITLETPSEFSLEKRIAAHRFAISEVIRLATQ